MRPDQLRVLHWNVHSWSDMTGAANVEIAAELVQATNPDAFSLVEVDESWAAASTVVAELANRLGYSWIFVPAFEYGQDVPAGGFGNALLTRLPILGACQRRLVWPPRQYDGTEPSECRSLVLAKLGGLSESFWVGSTHLPRSEAATRTAALRQVAEIVRGLSGHWLVCGDFNTPSSTWLESENRFAAFPQPERPTYPTGQPSEAIDYCIASPGLTVEVEVLPVTGSDHYPILLSSKGRLGAVSPEATRASRGGQDGA